MQLHIGPRRCGYTLVEILIVVAILGILAAMILPKYDSVASSSQESAVRKQLQTIRGQIELYRYNNGVWPDSLATLHGQGYTKTPVIHPGEGSFTYDADAGTIVSSVDGTW